MSWTEDGSLDIIIIWCGSLAQLVEQRPEEPCVPSSSLGGATKEKVSCNDMGLFLWPEFTRGLELEVRYSSKTEESQRPYSQLAQNIP